MGYYGEEWLTQLANVDLFQQPASSKEKAVRINSPEKRLQVTSGGCQIG